MARFLIATQTLVDLARRQNLPIEIWLERASDRGTYADNLYISAVTPSRIRIMIADWITTIRAGEAPPAITEDYLRALGRNAEQLIRIFEAGKRVIPADQPILDRWTHLLNDRGLGRETGNGFQRLSSTELLELATAVTGYDGKPFVLVAKDEPHLRRVNGLVVEDPAGEPGPADRPS